MPHLSVPGIIRETEEELRPVRHFVLEMRMKAGVVRACSTEIVTTPGRLSPRIQMKSTVSVVNTSLGCTKRAQAHHMLRLVAKGSWAHWLRRCFF